MSITELIEQRPHVGIIASAGGFVTSLLSYMQEINILLGTVGAIFGIVAGYYTFRVKRRNWQDLQKQDNEKH